MTEKKRLQKIEALGKEYCEKYPYQWNNNLLKTNWWEGLKFFFAHAFPRGRRDELSKEYRDFTIQTLKSHFLINDDNFNNSYEELKKLKQLYDKELILNFKKAKGIPKKNSIKHPNFDKDITSKNKIIKLLVTPKTVKLNWEGYIYEKEMYLGNDADVMMVLDILKFISENGNKNIYNTFLQIIQKQSLFKAYWKLKKFRAIGDKIATLIIRDIGLINIGTIKDDYELAFPVDTWVKQQSHKMGCSSNNNEEIKDFFIQRCKKYNLHPLKVAAGLWMWGFKNINIEE